jgi:ribosomal protein S19E (S16A)
MKANIADRRAIPQNALSEGEAATLRRIAFAESDIRTLRRDDLDKLRALGLIETVRTGLRLTASGAALFRQLPRSLFASAPRQHEGLPPR